MKKIVLIALGAFAVSAGAQVYVAPHVTKNGTYVDGHVRSAPNNTDNDNYSTRGNYNPYTGQAGTVTPRHDNYQVQQPKSQECGYTSTGRYVCR